MNRLCIQNQPELCRGSETERIENEVEGIRDDELEPEEFSIRLATQVYLPKPLSVETTEPVEPELFEDSPTPNIHAELTEVKGMKLRSNTREDDEEKQSPINYEVLDSEKTPSPPPQHSMPLTLQVLPPSIPNNADFINNENYPQYLMDYPAGEEEELHLSSINENEQMYQLEGPRYRPHARPSRATDSDTQEWYRFHEDLALTALSSRDT
nr:hypothetical protein Iba_chr03aCG3700 [Ipomoea batatas]